jgi:hypothetical protein
MKSRAQALLELRQVVPLQQEIHELQMTVCGLRHELENKEGYVDRLQFLLRERLHKIDQLNAVIDRLREQNRRLDEEAERYAEMVKLS